MGQGRGLFWGMYVMLLYQRCSLSSKETSGAPKKGKLQATDVGDGRRGWD